LGFDPLAAGVDRWEPIRWAAYHGNADLVRLLLRHNPPLDVPDPTYGGTPLGQCLHGSLYGWERENGDYATAVRLLLDAGSPLDPSWVPIGRDDVDAVLRAHLRPS
jgi:ankyrin repeat protein